jgi:hypothetical protein
MVNAALLADFDRYCAVVAVLEATGRLSSAATFEEVEAALETCRVELAELERAPEALAEVA